MVGSQSIWLLEEPLPVFSELVVGRLDNYSEMFTHSPTPISQVYFRALSLDLVGHVTFCGQQNEVEMTVAYLRVWAIRDFVCLHLLPYILPSP